MANGTVPVFQPKPLSSATAYWVDGGRGSDTRGEAGRADKPFATISAAMDRAVTDALAGAHVRIRAATYNETGISRDGIDLHFEPGVAIAFTTVLDAPATIDPVFGSGSYNVYGFPDVTLHVTETEETAAGATEVSIFDIDDDCRLEIGTTAIVGGLEEGSVGVGGMSAGTVYLRSRDISFLIEGGTLHAEITTGTLVATAGTANLSGDSITQLIVTGGSGHVFRVGTVTTATISGGTTNLLVGYLDRLAMTGGSLNASGGTLNRCDRSGTSGTLSLAFAKYIDNQTSTPIQVGINISSSGTAKTYAAGGLLVSSRESVGINVNTGHFHAKGMVVRGTFTGITNPSGHAAVITLGSTDVTNPISATLEDMAVEAIGNVNANAVRIVAEAHPSDVYRFVNGRYMGGSSTYAINPEAARTVYFYGAVTLNRSNSGSFLTPGGSGSLIDADTAMTL